MVGVQSPDSTLQLERRHPCHITRTPFDPGLESLQALGTGSSRVPIVSFPGSSLPWKSPSHHDPSPLCPSSLSWDTHSHQSSRAPWHRLTWDRWWAHPKP